MSFSSFAQITHPIANDERAEDQATYEILTVFIPVSKLSILCLFHDQLTFIACYQM